MLLYHMDRSRTIALDREICLFPLSSLSNGAFSNSPFLSAFPFGLSRHGINQLKTDCKYLNSDVSKNGEILLHPQSFANNKAVIDEQIIEIVFELVRRAHFPNLPSRFTSLFAVNDYKEFKKWPELLESNEYSILEIDASDKTPCFDASFLRGGLIFGEESGKFYFGFLPVTIADYAFRYWSGEVSETPRMEYLISLPISSEHFRAGKSSLDELANHPD